MRISQLRQRLHDLGAKPCHEDRLLRGWLQAGSRSGSISQVKQGGDEKATQAVQVARQGASKKANAVSPMKWNWNYDRKHSPAATFFPQAMRDALPGIEAELQSLATVQSVHPVTLSPSLSRRPSPQSSPASGRGGKRENPSINLAGVGEDAALRASYNDDEVARLLVRLHDGQMVESVLLPRGGLCVSTQVGCAVGCTFCMSGRNGLLRQMGSAEIVAQVVLARQRRAVSKVVFMGMGEPAHNLDNVLEAIAVLGTQGNIGHKNLVLSTVGDLRVFERLMNSATPLPNPLPLRGEGTNAASGWLANPPVRPALALSLHTTDDALRAQLLPQAPRIPVAELVERAEAYARATAYPVQYQWTLIEGVNDSDAELARIAQLLAGKYAIMNFIPFNAVDGLSYRRPSPERIALMAHTLHRQGILVRIRDSAGQEIEGACGQLRARAVQAR
ncbi:MAG TPA: RNA methyltransferase [Gallionellaceae bacterium]|nr:RNA methyltransferase [Gallionellaceae bacterium]